MAINKVGSKGIADGAVAQAEFADNAVTSDKLQNGAVSNAKLSNTTITLAGESITLGASASLTNKFVDWQSVITADGSTFNTAVSGQGYFIDTTSAVHTINLPAAASRGDFIAIKDYAGTFGTNNLTIARNGHNIQGVANNSLISTNRASLVLVYVDTTKGWLYWEEHNVANLGNFISATGGTITTSGDFKIHTFTGDGCFVVSNVGYTGNIDYLVIAGGGSGGAGGNDVQGGGGGGGGAGGYRTTFPSPGCNAGAFPIATQTYPITVGGGGASQCTVETDGNPGSNSVFSTITSTGGGGGAKGIFAPLTYAAGLPGGSGGGAGSGGNSASGSASGGAGNTPPTNPSQGNPGGNVCGPAVRIGAGGGGATAAGGVAGLTGTGGAGATSSINGTPTARGGGGGGGHGGGAGRLGGSGGGGRGGANAGTLAVAGTTNTGGGGGGGSDASTPAIIGAAGGSGIVIIRYKFQ